MGRNSNYTKVASIVERVVSDEEMGLRKPKVFIDLLEEAVKAASRLPKGQGLAVSAAIPKGTLTGQWSTAKREGRINGECSYHFHKGRIYITPNRGHQ